MAGLALVALPLGLTVHPSLVGTAAIFGATALRLRARSSIASQHWNRPTPGGLSCPFCLRHHPPRFPFTVCQYEDCRRAPHTTLCVCNRCYLKELTDSRRTDILWTAQSLTSLNPGVPINDFKRKASAPALVTGRQGTEGPTMPQLLEEIARRPADDAPRLVLADLLSEQNDTQGEFIALQVAAARCADAPVGQARLRERHLLHRHRSA
jgi:uncharacterized protein (TIGR02996 family)